MNSVIEFLNNADNRALLGWLGGGLATFAGGLWVVLRYFLDHQKNKPKEFKAREDTSVVVGKGIGIGGRDNQINIGSLRVGLGLQGLFWIGLLLIIIAYLGQFLRHDLVKLPSFAFELDCRPNVEGTVHRLTDEEANLFNRFRDFGEQNDGSAIYLSLAINADSAAGGCARIGSIDGKRKKVPGSKINDDFPPAGAPLIYIDSTQMADRKEFLAEVEKHGRELLALLPDKWAKTTYFYLPNYAQIPENGVYRRGAYGSLLAYDGPFVAHFEDGTGYQNIYFEPIGDPSAAVRANIDCLRQHDQLNFLKRFALNCF